MFYAGLLSHGTNLLLQDKLFSGPGGKYLTVTDQDEWLPCASPSQRNTVTRHPGFVTLQLKAH